MTRMGRRAVIGVLLLCAVVLVGALGCSEEADDPQDLSGTLHATASILLVEDEIGEQVEVRLTLVSTAFADNPTFVEDATDVTLDFAGLQTADGSPLTLTGQAVRLKAPEGGAPETTTFYQILSRQQPLLQYKPGAFYELGFTVAGQRHTMFIVAPEEETNISKASEEAVNKKLEIVSSNEFSAGIVEVVRLANVNDPTYVSYPYKDTFLTSAADVIDSVGLLEDAAGSLITIPPEAFNRSGTHRVNYFGLKVHRAGSPNLSDSLGEFSSIYSGRVAQVEAEVR